MSEITEPETFCSFIKFANSVRPTIDIACDTKTMHSRFYDNDHISMCDIRMPYVTKEPFNFNMNISFAIQSLMPFQHTKQQLDMTRQNNSIVFSNDVRTTRYDIEILDEKPEFMKDPVLKDMTRVECKKKDIDRMIRDVMSIDGDTISIQGASPIKTAYKNVIRYESIEEKGQISSMFPVNKDVDFLSYFSMEYIRPIRYLKYKEAYISFGDIKPLHLTINPKPGYYLDYWVAPRTQA